MTLLKVAHPPQLKRRQDKNKQKSSKPKPRPSKGSCNCHTCLKRGIHTILFTFLIVHIIWGFAETLVAMGVDFIIIHPQGQDGFTLLPDFYMVDITEYEHQEWELEDNIKFHDQSKREEKVLQIRAKLIKHCSKFKKKDRIEENYHSNCNLPSDEIVDGFRDNNYFCAVIEHPEKFHTAFELLVKLWLATCCLFLCSLPLVLFAFVWQSQCIRLLLLHMIIQIVPILTSGVLLYILWVKDKFILCGLEYMYWEIPVRIIMTFVILIKLLVKGLELAFTIWFIILIKVEREQRGFGSRIQRTRVDPEEDEIVTFNNEVLQTSRNEDEEKPEVDRIEKFGVHPKRPTLKEKDNKKVKVKTKGQKPLRMASVSATNLSPDQYLPPNE